MYDRKPACGFPPDAPPGTHLLPPYGLFCPYQTVTYTCDIGGINEIKDQTDRYYVVVGVLNRIRGIDPDPTWLLFVLRRHTVEGLCSPEGTFVNPVEFDEVPVTVECVASYTCDLLDNIVPPTPGRFVCDELAMPVGSQCHLVCDDGYLPEEAVHNTCTYDNVTEEYK